MEYFGRPRWSLRFPLHRRPCDRFSIESQSGVQRRVGVFEYRTECIERIGTLGGEPLDEDVRPKTRVRRDEDLALLHEAEEPFTNKLRQDSTHVQLLNDRRFVLSQQQAVRRHLVNINLFWSCGRSRVSQQFYKYPHSNSYVTSAQGVQSKLLNFTSLSIILKKLI